MSAEPKPTDQEEINLLDILIVLLRRKRFIFWITFGFAFIAAIASVLMTPKFKATALILPPKEKRGAGSKLLAGMGGVAGLLAGLADVEGGGPEALYIQLLKVDPVIDRVIDRFNLLDYYEVQSREIGRRVLVGCLDAGADKKSEIITISVVDKDPKKAATLANAFVEELKEILDQLAVTEASKQRLFFEQQLRKTHDNLVEAEEAVKAFQEATGAVSIQDQARSVLVEIMAFRKLVSQREVSLKVMKTYLTENHPDIKKANEELTALKEELAKLEAKGGKLLPKNIIAAEELPSLATEYLRRERDFRYQEKMYESLAKQYEMARLDEAREATVVQIIQEAKPPERKFKPKRALMVIMAGGFGFLFSVFTVGIMEFILRILHNPDNRERIQELENLSEAEKWGHLVKVSYWKARFVNLFSNGFFGSKYLRGSIRKGNNKKYFGSR